MNNANGMNAMNNRNNIDNINVMGAIANTNNLNKMNNANNGNNMNNINEVRNINSLNNNMNNINPVNSLNSMNYNTMNTMGNLNSVSNMQNLGSVNQVNNSNQANQFTNRNQSFQVPNAHRPGINHQTLSNNGQVSNAEYIQSLLRKLQPEPGMTKQEKFKQLLKNGELTRSDVQLLQRHQAMIKQAHIMRQRQAQQQSLQAQISQQTSRTAGKSIPGKTLPNASGSEGFAGNIAGKTVPGKTVPGKTVPGKTVPGKTVPGKSITAGIRNSRSYSQSPVAGKSMPGAQQAQYQDNLNVISPMGAGMPVKNASVNMNNHANVPNNQSLNTLVNTSINAPVNKPVNNPINNAQVAKLKQNEQKRLLQQQQQKYFGLTPEQYEKLTPQQKQMVKMQYLRRKAKTHRFYEADQELLKKYENSPPSMDFHIHEDHYKFGNSDNLIPKSDPSIKDFLRHVAKKQIPDALMEIIKDGNIQLYEGNIILRIFDHRTKARKNGIKNSPSLTKSEPVSQSSDGVTPQKDDKGDLASSKKPFKEYRTILRLTQSGLYEDFCLTTDTQLFGDSFVLTFESELLTATARNVNLQPIQNPYLQDKSLWPTEQMVLPTYDEVNDKMVFPHRKDMREVVNERFRPNKKRKLIDFENYSYKPLHNDESQLNSKYEKFMLIMNESSAHSNISINKQDIELPRFERLRFVESLRRQNLLNKEVNTNGLNSETSNVGGYTGLSGLRGVNTKPFSAGLPTKNDNITEVKANTQDDEKKTTKPNTKVPASKKKADKPKKPRKPTKKQLAAQAAAENGTPVETKKKKTPAKKKA